MPVVLLKGPAAGSTDRSSQQKESNCGKIFSLENFISLRIILKYFFNSPH